MNISAPFGAALFAGTALLTLAATDWALAQGGGDVGTLTVNPLARIAA